MALLGDHMTLVGQLIRHDYLFRASMTSRTANS